MRRLVISVLVLVGASLLTAPPATAADADCADFATQAAAQAFFTAAGPGDPHRLDSDGDGVACESNPCPCSTSPVPVAGTPTPTAAPTTPVATPTTDPDGSGGGPGRREHVRVVRVTDGDTLVVRLPDGSEEYVRILGIDTPEVHGRRECGGTEASRSMRGLAPVGSRVLLLSDPSQADRDRYGRLLRYVHRSGTDVGRAQVLRGRAQVYVHRDDPFRRTASYRRAERRAMARERGLWGRCWR
ncbi:thermonuclease family protein [Nocardioides xinjiangensis]|uniref:thermonuclease family protein n=1 Tax=Nocardioides xinjiangensis TaxID=2817376 RepID=UPI001B30F910|nr:thermonuclease family protein [Nocardioides sp. SYSU D00778]